ncbi:MAG: hypothetical protein QW199_00350 [Candidatus Pacearchaeota archaeon]
MSNEDLIRRIKYAEERGEKPPFLLYQILKERGIKLRKNKDRYGWNSMDDDKEIIEKAKKLGLVGKSAAELIKLPGGASLYKVIRERREAGDEELYNAIIKESQKFYSKPLKPLKEKIFFEEQEIKLDSCSAIEKITLDFIKEHNFKNYRFDESESKYIEYSNFDGAYHINFKNYRNTVYASIKKFFYGDVSSIDVEIKRAIIGKKGYKNYKGAPPVLRLCDKIIALDFGPTFEISII